MNLLLLTCIVGPVPSRGSARHKQTSASREVADREKCRHKTHAFPEQNAADGSSIMTPSPAYADESC